MDVKICIVFPLFNVSKRKNLICNISLISLICGLFPWIIWQTYGIACYHWNFNFYCLFLAGFPASSLIELIEIKDTNLVFKYWTDQWKCLCRCCCARLLFVGYPYMFTKAIFIFKSFVAVVACSWGLGC